MDQLAEYSLSHCCYSPLITRGSTGREQLLTLLLLSTDHQWVSWQRTAGHTSIYLQSSAVDQLAEHTWSHFCYSPLIPGYQLAQYCWSHFCYSPIITRGSAGKVQLVTLLLLSTHHPRISWQSTAVHTSVTFHSSPVDQLAEYSWSHFCYSPLITRRSAGRAQLVTLLLLSSHHPCVSWQSTLVTLQLLSTQHPCVSWQSTAGHTSISLHSSPVDQLAEYCCSHFCYSPLITRGSAGRVQLVTLLLLSTYHPLISWQNTSGHTSVTLQSSPVCQRTEHTGHTSVTFHSTHVCQLAEYS